VHYTGKQAVDCIFAERRSIINEVFAGLLHDRLSRGK
jgi:hypothetical protein